MNVPKIQCCNPHKKVDKNYSDKSFGINPNETQRPVKDIAVELGDAIIREASKTIEQAKKDAQPAIKKIKQAAKFVSEKLAKFAEEGQEASKELPKQ